MKKTFLFVILILFVFNGFSQYDIEFQKEDTCELILVDSILINGKLHYYMTGDSLYNTKVI